MTLFEGNLPQKRQSERERERNPERKSERKRKERNKERKKKERERASKAPQVSSLIGFTRFVNVHNSIWLV